MGQTKSVQKYLYIYWLGQYFFLLYCIRIGVYDIRKSDARNNKFYGNWLPLLPKQLAPTTTYHAYHGVNTFYTKYANGYRCLFIFIIVAFWMDCKLIVFGGVVVYLYIHVNSVYLYIHTILIFHLERHIPKRTRCACVRTRICIVLAVKVTHATKKRIIYEIWHGMTIQTHATKSKGKHDGFVCVCNSQCQTHT